MEQEGYTAVGLVGLGVPGSGTSRAISVGPDFWKELPADPEAFADAVKYGEGVSIILDIYHSCDVKEIYGGFGRCRLLRRLQEWQRDPLAFIKKYSPKLSSAVRSFENDYMAYKKASERKYSDICRTLPAPPAGYYWKPDDAVIRTVGESFGEEGDLRELRLWNDAFGVMPSFGTNWR